MHSRMRLLAVVALVLFCGTAHAFTCPYYIYAFGDSLTDTGNAQAELPAFYALTAYPYGIDYRFPDRPCERTRFCDGRLILDYTAQAFKFPFIEPYARRFPDVNYSHGVNFAYSGATARFSALPLPTFYLGREVAKYINFKASFKGTTFPKYSLIRANYINFKASFKGTVDVSTAMHLISEIGGNDFTYAFTLGTTPAQAMATLTNKVIDAIKQNIEKIHDEGAKFFYIINQPPAGCTPYYLTLFAGKSPLDRYGCLSEYNAVFQDLNSKLKAAVDSYRQQWPDTTILYFDWYNASFEVTGNPGTYGIQPNGNRACCGGGGPYNFNLAIQCGPFASVCADPEHTVFWDGVHFTEGYNCVIATFALLGKFVDGPSNAKNLQAACNLDFSSFNTIIPNPKTLTCR